MPIDDDGLGVNSDDSTGRKPVADVRKRAPTAGEWECPIHGGVYLVTLTSRQGRTYRCCKGCDDFERPIWDVPKTRARCLSVEDGIPCANPAV